MKTCTGCQLTKPEDEFYFLNARQHHAPRCKDCQRAATNAWRAENPERAREQIIEWREQNRARTVEFTDNWRRRNPEKQALNARRYGLKRFGLTPEQYDTMLEQQNFSCAICERHHTEFKRRLAVDHNHSTGKVRALLCDNCNKGIGCLQESPRVLTSAIQYLNRHE